MDIYVLVIFYLIGGGQVRVERINDGSVLNEYDCEVMATDVVNELAGSGNPLGAPRIDMNKIEKIRYTCQWIM